MSAVVGILLAVFSDRIDSKRKVQVLWAVGGACAVIAFLAHDHPASIVPLACAYTLIIVLWRFDIANKGFRTSALIYSTLACAIVLVICSLLDEIAAGFLPYLLLCISFALFLPSLSNALEQWEHVAKGEMLKGSAPWRRMFYHACSKLVGGVAYGILALLYQPALAIVVAGCSHLAAFAWLAIYQRVDKQITRRAFRNAEAAIVLAALTVGIAVPEEWKAVLSFALIAVIVIDSQVEAISRVHIKKDRGLSDLFYFSARHSFGAVGTAVGFAGITVLASTAGFDNPATYAFQGGAALLFLLAVQTSVGAYGKKHGKRQVAETVTVYVDPWHEKMLKVAREHDLTARQTEIFDALSRGRNAKYIMGRLYLSEGMVKKYSHQIYKKLGVHNQQDLITMVMRATPDDPEADFR